MKQIIYAIWVCLITGLFACEDALDMNPENSLTFKNAIETESDMEAVVRNVEVSIRDIMGTGDLYRNIEMGLFADNVLGDIENGTRNLEPQYIRKSTWFEWYQIIGKADVVLAYVDQIEASQERKDYYRGQACFYKAYVYFELVRQWGDCVIMGDMTDLTPKAKSPWTEVIDYAIDLAREAVALLPEYDKITDSNGNAPSYKNEPCKGAANALLAHLCAWKAGGKYYAQPDQRDYDENALWEEAEQACTAIIGSETGTATGLYRLAANPEEVCTVVLRGRSTESIFEIEYRAFWEERHNNLEDNAVTNLDANALCYHYWFFMQSMGMGLQGIQSCPYQIYATTAKEMFPEGDLRRESYFYKLDELSDESLLPTTGGLAYPYAYREMRFITSGSDAGMFEHFDYNWVIYRLADIYLLRAECRARLNKNAEAIADLNEIRKRANAKLYDASEYDGDLRFAIFKEREKELLYEGQRYYDIIRNGYARQELSEGFRQATDQDFIDGCFFFAIQDWDFERNPLLRQNTWWHKYM